MPPITRGCPTQCAGVLSTCPYIIVALVGMPSSWAVVMTSIQLAEHDYALHQRRVRGDLPMPAPGRWHQAR